MTMWRSLPSGGLVLLVGLLALTGSGLPGLDPGEVENTVHQMPVEVPTCYRDGKHLS